MTEQTAANNNSRYNNDVQLTLISEPKVREGISKDGKPYNMLEVNAFKRNFEKNQETGQWDKKPPTYYKLTCFGDKEHIKDLSNRLCENMSIKASGFESDYTYKDKEGNDRTIKQMNPKVLSLDISQPRLMIDKIDIDNNSIPKGFHEMNADFQAGRMSLGQPAGERTYKSALPLRVLEVQVPEPSKEQTETGKRNVRVIACNPDTKDVYLFEKEQMSAADAHGLKRDLAPGMGVRISGEITPAGNNRFVGNLKSIGIDLQQDGIKSIEHSDRPPFGQYDPRRQRPAADRAEQQQPNPYQTQQQDNPYNKLQPQAQQFQQRQQPSFER